MPATSPAISLHAWSTGKQGDDDRDSRTRQQRACDEFCQRHGLTLIATQTIAGQSAYKGTGSFRGDAIDALIEQRRAGRLPAGVVLVVEELSRLSRKNPVDVLGGIISDLWGSDIALGICQLDLLVDRDRARRESHLLHQIIAGAQVSHEESERKSKRSKSAWTGAKAAAEQGKVTRTGVCPYWLQWDASSNGWVETPHADVVRRIFDLSADGLGVSRIAGILNDDGVASHGGKNGKFSFRLVHKLLTDRAVIGDWLTRDGQLIAEGHYLPIVSAAKFEQVQQGLKARLTDRSNRQCRVRNLLQGMTRCARCQRKMSYIGRERNGRRTEYLVCNGVREHLCEQNKMYRYDEDHLLRSVLRGHWAEWFNSTSQSEELTAAREQVNRLQLEQATDTRRLHGMEQRYQEAFADGRLTSTDQRLQGAAIEQLTVLIAERAERLSEAEGRQQRLATAAQQLDGEQLVQRVLDALERSGEWDAAERLTFNRWLNDQGVVVEIDHGCVERGELIGVEGVSRDVPSELDWWLMVRWGDECRELVEGIAA